MSDTYNPIIKKDKLTITSRLVAEPHTALVLSSSKKGLQTILPGQKPNLTLAERMGFEQVYTIDMSEHRLELVCELPGKADAFHFQTLAQFRYRVSQPEVIIERNTTNTREVIEPLIIAVMRRASRRHEPEGVGAAEEEISIKVREDEEIRSTGFEMTRVALTMSLDDETRKLLKERNRKIAEIRSTAEIEIEQRALDQKRAEFAQQNDAAQRNQEYAVKRQDVSETVEYEKLSHVLEQQRAEFELQRAAEEVKLLQTKMDFYGTLVKEGNWQLLGLQLSKNPDDVAGIIDMINKQQFILQQQHHAGLSNELQLLQILVEGDALDGDHLNEAGRSVLKHLWQRVNASAGQFEPLTPALPSASQPPSDTSGAPNNASSKESSDDEDDMHKDLR